MGIDNAFRAFKATEMSEDNSTASLTQLPLNLLEAFIPGYSVISKFLFEVLGFDITLAVSVCLLVFGLYTSIKFLWTHALDQFREYFMSFVSVDSDDDIYFHVMNWLQSQTIVKESRSLVAKTGHESIWDLQDADTEDKSLDPNALLNFSNWDAKVPPKFQPYFGSHRFFHKGRYFEFKRETKSVATQGWGGTVFQNDETIRLTCIGRSTQPIKNLINECRDSYLDKGKANTVVRRPAPKENRNRGRSVWNMVATRPSRPMETVVLDPAQKERVLTDINEYLHPSTPRWYANRGIPYRRGYLFAGPPGTGKSSLAWAISGVFGLDIYCISLVEPTLTEEDLGIMFTSLPRRCVVLLEDIDSAGLIKRQDAEEANKDKSKEEDATTNIGTEIAKALKAVQDKNEKSKSNDKTQGISLSGLLNAIDGVASHEGRVLVMTTNFPEKLDDALIRPGRIDMTVNFTLATRSQICELFTRMYSPDLPARTLSESIKIDNNPNIKSGLQYRVNAKPRKNLENGVVKFKIGIDTPPQSPGIFAPKIASYSETTELGEIAVQFAQKLPEGVFSPAEIQGYLLTRKKEPMQALEEVEAWRDKFLESKAEKNRLASS